MASYHHLKATIRVGKAGITPGVLEEIKKQLDKHNVVKIKMLATFDPDLSKKEFAQSIATKVGAKLEHCIGGIIVLSKSK